MAIQSIDIYNQALMAQMYGAQTGAFAQRAGGIGTPVQPQQTEAIGTSTENASKFNWKNLNKFDTFLNGIATQKASGGTNEIPTDSIFSLAKFGPAQNVNNGNTTAQQSALMATLNNIDAHDIGLQGDRNGFAGQRKINLIA